MTTTSTPEYDRNLIVEKLNAALEKAADDVDNLPNEPGRRAAIKSRIAEAFVPILKELTLVNGVVEEDSSSG